MNYKLAQLLLASGQKSQTICDVYIAQPDGQKEELAGKLFIVAEIKSNKKDDSDFLNFLINDINYNYYQNEKLILRERITTLKIEHIFESSLIKTNKNLADFVKEENININLHNLNITIGVVFNNEIHFASLGKNRILLIYKNKKDNIYKLTDINEKTKQKDDTEDINLAKLFHNVISGQIPDDGYLIITNEALPEYLSNKQFIDIVTTLPPISAAEQIKNTLSEINSYVSFLSIIIKNTIGSLKVSDNAYEVPAIPRPAPVIAKTEEATEKILSPSGIINLKKRSGILSFIQPVIEWIGSIKLRPSYSAGTVVLKDKIFFNKQSYLQGLKKMWGFLKDVFIYLINIIIYLIKQLANLKNLWPSIRKIGSTTITGFKATINWIKTLSRSNKIYLSIIILCIIVLGVNVFLLKKKNDNNQKNNEYANITEQIEQKQNQVDASILYNDEARAKNLFNEIKNLMAQLPQDTKEQQDAINKINDKMNQQILKINKAVNLADIPQLADLSGAGANANPSKMVFLTNSKQLYIVDNNTKQVHILNTDNKTLKNLPIDDKIIGSLNYPVNDKNNFVYFVKGESLISLDIAKQTFNTVKLAKQLSESDTGGAASFNNRLYIANKKESQIYKYEKLSQEPVTGVAWLKEAFDMSKATDIAIDGNIYILTDNNISLFANGKKEEFKLTEVIPAMEQLTRIRVTPDADFIYVMEAKNKRILSFNKKGDLIAQYLSDKFTDLRDIAIDETGSKLFVLNGNIVYSIDTTKK